MSLYPTIYGAFDQINIDNNVIAAFMTDFELVTELLYNNWLGTFQMNNIGGWLGIGQLPQPEARDYHNWFWRAINGTGNPLCFVAGI
jgi:hypothetical protein